MPRSPDLDYSAGPPIDDLMVERLLTGVEIPSELLPLVSVVEALRQEARRPVRPNAELAALLAGGAGPARAPARHRRPAAAGAVARLGRLRIAVGAAVTGVVVAVTGVATAGFAGVLPPEVQDRFDVVVDTVTPYDRWEPPAGPGGTGESGDGPSQRQPADDQSERGQRRIQQSGERGPDRKVDGAHDDGPSRHLPGRDSAPGQHRVPGPEQSAGPASTDTGPPGPPGVPGPPNRPGPPHQPGPPVPFGP